MSEAVLMSFRDSRAAWALASLKINTSAKQNLHAGFELV